MTTHDLQVVLSGAVVCIAGAPMLLLHAFFFRAERLVTKARVRVFICIVGAGVFMVLTGFFIYYYLPSNWQWVQWVNIAAFVLTLLVCARRYRIWQMCNRFSSELSLQEFGLVAQFGYNALRCNVEIELRSEAYLRVTFLTFISVSRSFKVTDMDARAVLREMDNNLRRMGTATLQNPHPKVQYERDGLAGGPIRVIKMMHDTESRDMLAYVN